ncbi:MAG: rhomboid family intramembrane serine protease [Planctomycetes bacterium]|nr:rhomboid family intramembrane serine protease [Planctomycetota bacterium]
MGIYERDYYRRDLLPPATIGPRLPMWSINTWLIVINVAVFVLDGLLMGTVGYYNYHGMRMGPIEYWGFFSAQTAIEHWQLWRFISFQFLHATFEHILFNMIGLYFFGSMIEQYLGSRRYVAFYLLCGAAGGLSYVALWEAHLIISASWMPLIGASAGVYGVLIASARLAPDEMIFIFPIPVPIKLRTLAWFLLALAVVVIIRHRPGENAGGQAAHLGGALVGFLLIRNIGLLNFLTGLTLPTFRFRRRDVDEVNRPSDRAFDYEIDRILAKIARQGMDSLSEQEKNLLRQDTQRRRR